MKQRFLEELDNIYWFVEKYKSEALVAGFASLALVLNRYNSFGSDWLSALVYYGALPVLVIVLILNKNPLDFGLRLGNARVWVFYVVVTCLAAVPILSVALLFPSLRGYYKAEHFDIVRYSLKYIAILSSSEFLLRGFLLFGLKEKLKEASIILQTIPFVLIHFGKPELETVSTLVTGLYFGYVAYRGNSFWPAFIIHLFINIFFVSAANLLP